MQFTNPIWLWGLTGLLIPIGIHLLSRKEGKVIRIGSLRHLEESNTKQSINLRLNELILLAIRCSLITLIVLLLSGLHFSSDQTNSERWVIIERGLENDIEFTPLIDSLQRQGFLVKCLAAGFPAIDDSAMNTRINYWKLMEELKTKSLQQSVVFSNSFVECFRGKRSSMPANLTWISKHHSRIEFPLNAVKASTSSVSIRMGSSSGDETTFVNLIESVNPNQSSIKSSSGHDSIRIQSPDTLTITIVSDLEFEYDKKILLAALYTLEESVSTIFNIKLLEPHEWRSDEKTDWVIWLSSKTISTPTNSILFKEETTNKPLLEQGDIRLGKSVWLLTKRLNEEVALQEKLIIKLASILLSKEESERRTFEFDRRVQPEKMLWSPEEQSSTTKIIANTNTNSFTQFLVILMLISLVAERLIAFKRNQ